MHLHEKIGIFRVLKGLTQEEMAHKLNLSTTGYAKIERGETKLQTDRLEKIVSIFGVDLKDFVSFDEKMVFNASFHHNESCQHQSYHIGSAKELTHEIEKLQLINKQREEENKLLRDQIEQLKDVIELMKKVLKNDQV